MPDGILLEIPEIVGFSQRKYYNFLKVKFDLDSVSYWSGAKESYDVI